MRPPVHFLRMGLRIRKSVGSIVSAMTQAPLISENSARGILSVTGHKLLLLFLFLLLALALSPHVVETGARYRVCRMFGAAVTLMTVYAVSFRRGLIFVALVLA